MQAAQWNGADVEVLMRGMRKVISRFVKNEHDKEDIAQEALHNLFKSTGRVHPDKAYSYAFVVARYAALDFLRAHKVRGGDRLELETVMSQAEEDAVSLPLFVGECDVHADPFVLKRIAEALNKIPRLKREALVLNLNGYSYDEIAELQAANKGTVRSRLSFARKKMQEMLQDLRD